MYIDIEFALFCSSLSIFFFFVFVVKAPVGSSHSYLQYPDLVTGKEMLGYVAKAPDGIVCGHVAVLMDDLLDDLRIFDMKSDAIDGSQLKPI